MTYDNSLVTVASGGYGSCNTCGGYVTLGAANWTMAFANTRVRASGRLSGFKMRLYGYNEPTIAKLKILSGAAKGAVALVQDIDILIPMVADYGAARFTLDLETWLVSNEINVTEGQFFGLYTYNVAGNAVRLLSKDANTPADPEGDGVWGYTTGDHTTGTVDYTQPEQTEAPLMEFEVLTAERVLYDSDDGSLGPFGTGEAVNIPAYTDQSYYIMLEGVQCPDTDTLAIAFNYTDAAGADDTITIDAKAGNLLLNYDGGGDTDKLGIGDYTTFKAIASQEAENFNIHVWIDPVNHLMDIAFCNYQDGQGGLSDRDIQHIPLMDGTAQAITDAVIRRLAITSTAGTIDRIIVCREPVVVPGDSFVSTYGTITELSRIGAALDDAGIFSEKRYVINAGIAGAMILASNVASSGLTTRWNTLASDQYIVGYRDCIMCFVVGCANDATEASEADAYEMAARIVGAIGTMVGDTLDDTATLGGRSDCVICGPIGAPPDSDSDNYRTFFQRVNNGLRHLAYTANVPFVDLYGDEAKSQFTNFYASNNWHPSAAADSSIARKIAAAYESDAVPKAIRTMGSGIRGRYRGSGYR